MSASVLPLDILNSKGRTRWCRQPLVGSVWRRAAPVVFAVLCPLTSPAQPNVLVHHCLIHYDIIMFVGVV